jgi:hypothetical protein
MMQRTIVALLVLGVAGVLANVGSDHRAHAAIFEACPVSLALQLTPVSGLPPHASWRLPLDNQHGWRPLAVDARYAVLGREGWPGPNLALVRLGPNGAKVVHWNHFPHNAALLEDWHLEYPWIVGTYRPTRGPGPWLDLGWAGNIATGQTYSLGHAYQVALYHGHAAWLKFAIRPNGGVSSAHLVLFDLGNGTGRVLPGTREITGFPGEIAMSDRWIVWQRDTTPERGEFGGGATDLMALSRVTGAITRLSRARTVRRSSSRPSLSGSVLVFWYGDEFSGPRKAVAVRLGAQPDRQGGPWWSRYPHLTLGSSSNLDARDDIAEVDNKLIDLATGKTWDVSRLLRRPNGPGYGDPPIVGNGAVALVSDWRDYVWKLGFTPMGC